MAKKIIDNTPIQNFEDPWGGVYESGQDAGKEWGKTHSEVERVIKEKVADIEEELQDNADAIEGVTDAVFSKLDTDSNEDADLDITDGFGNVLVRFKNGHIKTKNFDSKNIEREIIDNTPIQNFEDPWGGVYESGQDAGKEWGKTHSEVERVIKEKVADIEEELQDNADAIEGVTDAVFSKLDTDSNEDADLDITDGFGNVLVRFKNGHIKTKNFDSKNIEREIHIEYDSSSKSIIATAESLAAGGSMSITNPDIKTHYMLSFTATLETMGTLSILVGSANNYSKGRVDVTPTEIVTYDWSTWDTHTYQHGLTFEDNISIAIKVKGVRKADLIIMTGNGENVYTKEIPWEGCSSGCTISNTGGSYEDCAFTANYYGLLKDVWFFGDSYLDRWALRLESMGFSGFLIDGFSGRASAAAVTSFQKDILLGKPKVVVWQLGMNDADSGSVNSAWKTAFDTMLAYCNANDIEFICCTIPNVPQRNHTYKNAYMQESGVRVIDIAAELGATEAGSTWYPGLLNTDNVHPTESGAMRIALAFLKNMGCLTL